MSGQNSQVDLLCARLPDAPLPELNNLANVLDFDEKNRFLAYIRDEDRWRFFLGRALLFFGLKTLFGLTTYELKLDPFGRPYLEFPRHFSFDFNISHSGRWVLCAFVQEGKVGVDIADLSEFGDYQVLFDAVLTPQEKALMDSICSSLKQKYFARYWTIKEAVLKFSGVGLQIEPTHICVDLSNYRCPKIKGCPSLISQDPEKLFVESWCFEADMMIALVTQKLCKNRNDNNQKLAPRIQFIPLETLLCVERFSDR